MVFQRKQQVRVAFILLLASSPCCSATILPLASRVTIGAIVVASILPGAQAQHSWGVNHSPDPPSVAMYSNNFDSGSESIERIHKGEQVSSSLASSGSTESSDSSSSSSGSSRTAHPWGGVNSFVNDYATTTEQAPTGATSFDPGLNTASIDGGSSQGHQSHAWSAQGFHGEPDERPENSRVENEVAPPKKGWNFPPLSEQRKRGRSTSEVKPTQINMKVA